MLHFWTPNDIIWYTIEEWLSIAPQYATNEEVVGPLLVPSGR
jgi:hypothetical protein